MAQEVAGVDLSNIPSDIFETIAADYAYGIKESNMSRFLTNITGFGYTAAYSAMGEKLNQIGRERGIITTRPEMTYCLHCSDSYIGLGAMVVFLKRFIMKDLPHMSSLGTYIFIDNYKDIRLHVKNTPAVSRYLRNNMEIMREVTTGAFTYNIEEISEGQWLKCVITAPETIPEGIAPLRRYLILKLVDGILKMLKTLHRVAMINEESLASSITVSKE